MMIISLFSIWNKNLSPAIPNYYQLISFSTLILIISTSINMNTYITFNIFTLIIIMSLKMITCNGRYSSPSHFVRHQ